MAIDGTVAERSILVSFAGLPSALACREIPAMQGDNYLLTYVLPDVYVFGDIESGN